MHGKLVFFELYIDIEETEHGQDDDPFNLGTVTLVPETRFNTTAFDELKKKLTHLHEMLMQV